MTTNTSELTRNIRELLAGSRYHGDRGEALHEFRRLIESQSWFPMYEQYPGMWIKAHKIALAEFDKRFYGGC